MNTLIEIIRWMLLPMVLALIAHLTEVELVWFIVGFAVVQFIITLLELVIITLLELDDERILQPLQGETLGFLLSVFAAVLVLLTFVSTALITLSYWLIGLFM